MKWKFYTLVVTSFVILVVFWIWKYHGFSDYINILVSINKLPSVQQQKVKDSFLANNDSYLYNGVLVGVNTNFIPGVFVLGSKGLKYFKIDNHSVYSYFSVCNEVSINSLIKNEKFAVGRTIDLDIKVWKKRVKNGQYVFVMITRPENGGVLGNLREIRAHDWLAFMPSDIKKQCEK